MAFLTEDRKDTGCLLILDVLENMQIAVLQDQLRQVRLRRRRARSTAPCEEMSDTLAGQDAEPGGGDREPLRRQPAEGADRPLAADQAAAS